MMIKLLFIYLVIVNIVTFAMYGIDKKRAIKDQWRISEKTLLGAAFIGGSFGAFAGMRVFRHKTQHGLFKILVPVYMIVHIIVIIFLLMEIM